MTRPPAENPARGGLAARVKARLRQPATWWAILAAAALALLYYRLGCPVRFFTGLPCPGCGMTRALGHAAGLRFEEAFHQHPLFWLAPVLAWLLLAKWARARPRLRNTALAVLGGVFVLTYLLRLFWFHSPVLAPARPGILQLFFT